MIRLCFISFWIFTTFFPAEAQIQTLHNTIAKGTVNVTGGLQFKKVSGLTFIPTNHFSFGINYCFKHRYSIGVESNLTTFKKVNFAPAIPWTSQNLFIGINLQRNDLFFKTKLGKFKITSLLSISSGSIFSSDELMEEKQLKKSNFNYTGLYTTGALGLRLEFIRRFFIEVKESGGYLIKNNVNLRLNDGQKISTRNWYTETQIKLGIFMFINTLDNCGTCPKW